MRLHVNCACATGTRLNLDLLCVAQNGIVLEIPRIAASQNCHSCQFAEKQAERGYYDKSDIVLHLTFSYLAIYISKWLLKALF